MATGGALRRREKERSVPRKKRASEMPSRLCLPQFLLRWDVAEGANAPRWARGKQGVAPLGRANCSVWPGKTISLSVIILCLSTHPSSLPSCLDQCIPRPLASASTLECQNGSRAEVQVCVCYRAAGRAHNLRPKCVQEGKGKGPLRTKPILDIRSFAICLFAQLSNSQRHWRWVEILAVR